LSSDRQDNGLDDPIEGDAGSPADLGDVFVGACPDQDQERLLTWNEGAGQHVDPTGLAGRGRLRDKPSHRRPRCRFVESRRVKLAEIRRSLGRSSAGRHRATLAEAR